MRVKNLKMFRAKEKLKTIEDEHQKMRDTLRDTIQHKLKLSQTKLESIIVNKHSRSNSKEKLRQTTLLRIKSNLKNSQEESFRKSQQLSKDSETFLLERKLSESRANTYTPANTTSFPHTPANTRYVEEESKKHESLALLESRKKVLPGVLRVSEKEIREKQARKSQLEESRDIRNLQEYVQKLTHIEARRQNRADRLADTVKLIEKSRKAEEQRYASRKRAESLEERAGRPGGSATSQAGSATSQAIKNKHSFSEFYAKKLEEKAARKAFFEERAMREGDLVLRREGELRVRRREGRLVSEAVREVQRRVNFNYMERFRG